MKINMFCVLFLLMQKISAFGAFAPNVVIRVHGGYRIISSFKKGDMIRSYHEQQGVFGNKVANLVSKQEKEAICIVLDEEVIVVSPDQYVFSVFAKNWRKTKDLMRGEQLLADSTAPVIIKDIYKLDKEIVLYDLKSDGIGTYFFSKSRILAVN